MRRSSCLLLVVLLGACSGGQRPAAGPATPDRLLNSLLGFSEPLPCLSRNDCGLAQCNTGYLGFLLDEPDSTATGRCSTLSSAGGTWERAMVRQAILRLVRNDPSVAPKVFERASAGLAGIDWTKGPDVQERALLELAVAMYADKSAAGFAEVRAAVEALVLPDRPVPWSVMLAAARERLAPDVRSRRHLGAAAASSDPVLRSLAFAGMAATCRQEELPALRQGWELESSRFVRHSILRGAAGCSPAFKAGLTAEGVSTRSDYESVLFAFPFLTSL